MKHPRSDGALQFVSVDFTRNSLNLKSHVQRRHQKYQDSPHVKCKIWNLILYFYYHQRFFFSDEQNIFNHLNEAVAFK